MWAGIKYIMSIRDIEKAVNNAAASVEIEGYHINEQTREWARQLLEGKNHNGRIYRNRPEAGGDAA